MPVSITRWSTFTIPEDGIVLRPGQTYLGSHLGIYGNPSGLSPFWRGSRAWAGWALISMQPRVKGDVGFCNHWTLEISVSQPVRVYARNAHRAADLFFGGGRSRGRLFQARPQLSTTNDPHCRLNQ